MDIAELRQKHDERHEEGDRWNEPLDVDMWGIKYLSIARIRANGTTHFLNALPNGWQALTDGMDGELILATKDTWPVDTPTYAKDFWHDVAGKEGMYGDDTAAE
jgi:hypothetical protein